MELIDTSFHHIDHANSKTVEINVTDKDGQLKEYVSQLLELIIAKSSGKRSFSFQSDTSEVKLALDLMLNDDFEKGKSINGERLLRVEKATQDKYSHITEIQKGILFQAHFKTEDRIVIVISKADHSEFLDESDLQLRRGLPWKKKVFKAAAVYFDLEGIVDEVFVLDTNTNISRYWWESYLGLREKYTDSHNTKTALDILDRKVFDKIKIEFPADHTILRNSAVGYFRSQEVFDIGHFANSLLSDYHPINPALDPQILKEKVLVLPERWKFDKKFSVIKKEIRKKMINRIPLTDSIELLLTDHISDLAGIIKAEKDEEGTKYIKIRTDEGYRRFSE